jgi:L-alanine-DL-glutamate epimerase-like enolase superfamily enzyme
MQHATLQGFDDMKKPVGRPPKAEDELSIHIGTRWPRPLIERVDAIAEARPDAPVRAAVMREALALGLDEMELRMKPRRK